MRSRFLPVIWLHLIPTITAFYLPGAAPRSYVEGEQVDIFVNALTPMLSGSNDAKLVPVVSWNNAFCPA
jgi:transmembrane 9 superfamily protein 2/4